MNSGAVLPVRRSITSRLTFGAIFLLKVVVVLEASVYLISTTLLLLSSNNNVEYIVVGVSGGLQDGFPEHTRLDYHAGERDEVQAIYLGRGLVRGYKAYLDVMQPTWRQYTEEPGQPLINSNVFASGCHEHANEYWVYLVDSRQVMTVLNHEPRFLSITPDTGQLDLNAVETWPLVRDFMRHEIQTQNKNNADYVAIPLVTAVWFNSESHVPSPPIYSHEDGTQVTNFPESLALWANVNDADRTAVIDCLERKCTMPAMKEAKDMEQQYWNGICKAIRSAEENRPTIKRQAKKHGPSFKCKQQVRFGVSNDTARINYPFSVKDVTNTLSRIGYTADYKSGIVNRIKKKTEL